MAGKIAEYDLKPNAATYSALLHACSKRRKHDDGGDGADSGVQSEDSKTAGEAAHRVRKASVDPVMCNRGGLSLIHI